MAATRNGAFERETRVSSQGSRRPVSPYARVPVAARSSVPFILTLVALMGAPTVLVLDGLLCATILVVASRKRAILDSGRAFFLIVPLPIIWAVTNPTPPFVELGLARVSVPGLQAGSLLFVRFAVVILAIGVARSTVSGGEWMRILCGLPGVAVLFAGTVRFAPIAIQELKAIKNAQDLRGLALRGKAGRKRSLRALVVPAFVLSGKRARNLSRALVVAGYEGEATRVGLVIAFASLAIAGRLLFLWIPNVALTYFVVFIAGVAYGTRVGFLSGLLAMAATDIALASGGAGILVNALPMALLGGVSGLLGRVDFGQKGDSPLPIAAVLAAVLGFAFSIFFSVAADSLSFGLAVVAGAPPDMTVYMVVVGGGLLFNGPAAVANSALFVALSYPVLSTLRRAGLVRPREAPREGISRVGLYGVKPA
ncbi:MAG: energy-coupling factor transporter transmembrane protein EcfT [Euryarchaeota archaeon]|nr:energy-coupling factor transporter transmembrane protein EcfT [Euryarchaeota archaeon]